MHYSRVSLSPMPTFFFQIFVKETLDSSHFDPELPGLVALWSKHQTNCSTTHCKIAPRIHLRANLGWCEKVFLYCNAYQASFLSCVSNLQMACMKSAHVGSSLNISMVDMTHSAMIITEHTSHFPVAVTLIHEQNYLGCFLFRNRHFSSFNVYSPGTLEFLLDIIGAGFFFFHKVVRNSTQMNILKVHNDLTGAFSSRGVGTP